MNTFFTSDSHFFHSNVIKYSERPFANVDEMHEALINNWNAEVKPKDKVYHLGDFALINNVDQINNILRRLNGSIFLIKGNHDRWAKRDANRFLKIQWIKDYHEFTDTRDGEKRKIVLCHYPMRAWNQSHYGSIQLHGHCHGALDKENLKINRLDVGVDSNNYTPVALEDIVLSCQNLNVDHHDFQ